MSLLTLLACAGGVIVGFVIGAVIGLLLIRFVFEPLFDRLWP